MPVSSSLPRTGHGDVKGAEGPGWRAAMTGDFFFFSNLVTVLFYEERRHHHRDPPSSHQARDLRLKRLL